MKRVIVLVVVLMLVGAIAISEGVDLSEMSYDELVNLRERINPAIWNSEDWQEVTVPQGTWIVGEDIPAGHWAIEAYPGNTTLIAIGDTLKENGKDVKSYTQRFYDPNRILIGIGGGATAIGGFFILMYLLTMLRWKKNSQ